MIGQIVFRDARLHRQPNIRAEKAGFIRLWEKVEVKRIHIIKQGVEEWAELGGEYDGWYVAKIYPNEKYILTFGRLGEAVNRMDIPPKPVYKAEMKSEFEMHHMSRPEFNQWDASKQKFKIPYDKIFPGLPGTIPLTPPAGKSIYVNLNYTYYVNVNGKKKSQTVLDFWNNALRVVAPHLSDAEILKASASLRKADRAFTNFDPMRYQIYSCIRAVHQLVSPVPFRKYNTDFYAIKTIRIDQSFQPDIYLKSLAENPFEDGWFFAAMNSLKKRNANGESIDETFWQLGGIFVPVPVMSYSGTSLLPVSWVKRIWQEE